MTEQVERLLQSVLELSRGEQADFLDALQIALGRRQDGLPVDDAWLKDLFRRMQERFADG